MPAVPADHERDRNLPVVENQAARVALIIVRVPRKKCMGVDVLRLANLVDLSQHDGVALCLPPELPLVLVVCVA